MTPEFSRPERADTIGERERTVEVAADNHECRRLAARFGLVAIDRLAAHFTLHRDTTGIIATGRVSAALVQRCSITGDPLPAKVDETVTLRFVEPALDEAEVELSPDALDTIEIEGGTIDLGEAAAETMALALDPFPRGPDAAAALKKAGVLSEDEVGAFGALAGLKAKLEGKA